ncbi:hypothetical protein [Agaribacterium sp. ZY112]|uniref:hypothetical protein n=1 Tax=Agaribacterium sp. ZY112 TaxID=3233574 RepID=UPI003524795B
MPDKLSKYSYASIKAIPSGEFVVGESYEIIYRHTFEAGGGGHFVFFKGDFSSEVANDPEEGVYLCLDEDPSGESYVLIRRLQGFICPHDFGAFGKEGVNDSTAIHAANNYAALVGLPLRFSNKTYFVGDASFVIEASKTSWFSDGLTLIKFSGFESRKKYAVRVVGSGSYVATVRLVKAFIKNIGIFANVQKGSELEGVGLELSGGTSATRLSSGSFDHISIQGFKTSVKFNDYCWKITLNNARLMWGVIETPSETQEFGENMVLRDCFIADTSGEFSRFNKGEWKFYGTSFDNAPFSSHNDAVLDFEGGHIENPLSQSSEPRFAEAYNFSSISFNATWIATNNRAIARPPFFCDTSVAKPSGLYFNTCKWVCYAEYDTREGGSNAGAMSHNFLVEGEGTVRSNNWTFLNWQDWLAIPLARSSNRLFNGDFERGDLRAWSVSEGLGGGTGIFEVNAVTGEGQRGAYCAEIRALHLGSHAFGGSLHQSIAVKPGDQIAGGLRLKSNWASVAGAGFFQVSLLYKSADGQLLLDKVVKKYNEQLSDWQYRQVGGIVPEGVSTVELTVIVLANEAAEDVSVWLDDAHITVYG